MPSTIRRIPLREWSDPERAFMALFGQSRHAFWLDAGVDATTGMSYLGAASRGTRFVTASVDAASGRKILTVTRPADPTVGDERHEGSIFEFLARELARVNRVNGVNAANRDVAAAHSLPQPERMPELTLGWVGWFGYELGATALGLPAHRSRFPDAAWLQADRVLAFDHAARTVTLIADAGQAQDPAELDDWVTWAAAQLRAANADADATATADANVETDAVDDHIAVPPTSTPAPTSTQASISTPTPTVAWRHSAAEYAELIRRCQEEIRAGNAYQLCLTNEIRVDATPDPVAAYLTLRRGSPSHHGGLLRFGDHSLLSATPEQFLTVTPEGRMRTKPIKGTRPRSADPDEDARLAAELLASDKERAENLMIVDLMRNDLGKVAALGSVQVTDLLAVESYEHVHQLVSTVSATLADGLSPLDAVASAFPAGSMTGAPKLRAMSILDELEAGPRGVYAGAFGYLGVDGSVDLAMVIRSIVLDQSGASVGTGGGITALSDPADEIEETLVKARALAAVLGVSESELATALGRV